MKRLYFIVVVGGEMENLSTVIERLKKLQQNLSEIGDSL